MHALIVTSDFQKCLGVNAKFAHFAHLFFQLMHRSALTVSTKLFTLFAAPEFFYPIRSIAFFMACIVAPQA